MIANNNNKKKNTVQIWWTGLFCFYLFEPIFVNDVCLSTPKVEIVLGYFAVYGLFFFVLTECELWIVMAN